MAERRGRRTAAARTPRRRTWIVVGVALLAGSVALGAWWGATTTRPGPTPRLVVDRDEVDLGYVRYGIRVRATFTLANAGDAPLLLRERPQVVLARGC